MTETPYNSVNDERLTALTKWLAANEVSYDALTVVSADAGFRRYFRLQKDNFSLIAVDAPVQFEDTRAFLDIAQRLAGSGLRPPQIQCYSLEKGFLVVEDFGHTHIQQKLQSEPDNHELTDQLYHKAISEISTMQQFTDTTDLPRCDRDFLMSELELFPRWYLQTHLGENIDQSHRDVLTRTFEILLTSATEQPYRFMHRDYHCRNLMVLDNNDLGIIDFQGAMAGPVTYDPVSLLKDAYLDWPLEFQHTFIEQHRTTLSPTVDQQTYRRWYDMMGLQRHLKILGIFCRLNYRDHKPYYLASLPRIRNHIETTIAEYPELSDFGHLFSDYHKDQNVA